MFGKRRGFMAEFESLKDQKLLGASDVARVLDMDRVLASPLVRTRQLVVTSNGRAVSSKAGDLRRN